MKEWVTKVKERRKPGKGGGFNSTLLEFRGGRAGGQGGGGGK